MRTGRRGLDSPGELVAAARTRQRRCSAPDSESFTTGLTRATCWTENRLNNVNLTQFVVTNPAFYAPTPPPLVPSTTTLESYYLYNNRQKSPGTMQMAISLERQLTKWANLNVSYLHSQGWDQLLTNNVNTPTGITFPYYLNPGTRHATSSVRRAVREHLSVLVGGEL